jgi:transcription elongation factor GreA
MRESSLHDATLAEIAAEFLSYISPGRRGEIQAEVYKCVRWLGLQRKPKELRPSDIANYAEQIAPSEGKALKDFLSYMRKNELTSVNLAAHARPKKATLKTSALNADIQEEVTFTEEGYDKIKNELSLLEAQIPGAIKEIQKAAADKDFRENAPLDAAREEKARLEGRIIELKAILKRAKTINGNSGATIVELGSTVQLSDASSGREFIYLLVDSREADIRHGKLSVASPLGKVLLGKKKGQFISVDAPAGAFSYCIEDVYRA